MNRTTVITALACGLLFTAAAATPALAATSDSVDGSSRSTGGVGSPDANDADTLLINGHALLLE
ncbi:MULTISPECIES: hypothetical protein [unclassified Rathayibacter]|uniref:hypothetical protein n=1 Tax=unclassified Rathayibacter TaxID=2609250 RepID=UPI00188B0361|nr:MULTISPECIES: hypothetical protein [unclassified Rathayibacter]MBF4461188.1 hypothetical protein [Rathayibacter sp. VKM Ac-2879]MBF4502599.1 hypothetical protein [Rathayibacter sp. VKM Ac-2878]